MDDEAELSGDASGDEHCTDSDAASHDSFLDDLTPSSEDSDLHMWAPALSLSLSLVLNSLVDSSLFLFLSLSFKLEFL